jgi:hypothetical protein
MYHQCKAKRLAYAMEEIFEKHEEFIVPSQERLVSYTPLSKKMLLPLGLKVSLEAHNYFAEKLSKQIKGLV